MTSLEEAYEYVKKNLKENRFIHTLGVIEEAKKLAKINGVKKRQKWQLYVMILQKIYLKQKC